MQKGEVVAISISPERGQLKQPVPEARLIENFGLEHDGHGGDWNRQVSLLAWEDIEKAASEHHLEIKPGDFAENIITRGLVLSALSVGTRVKIGAEAVLEVTQLGKEHHESVVTRSLRISLIPDVGIFARVSRGGWVRNGDNIEVFG